VEVHGKPIVFLSGADAARVLNLDPGGVRRSLTLAADLQLIERVRQGYRPNAKAKGMASEYRVPWMGLDTSNSSGNG
jgi:predicted transcriptional regulator